MTNLITTPAEQQAYNTESCTECGLLRFQHLNAILCAENQVTLDDVLAEIRAMRTELQSVKSFVDQLETAVRQHPMGKLLLG